MSCNNYVYMLFIQNIQHVYHSMPVIAHVIPQLNVTYRYLPVHWTFQIVPTRALRRIGESRDTSLAQSHTCTVRCDRFSNYHGFVRAPDFLVVY